MLATRQKLLDRAEKSTADAFKTAVTLKRLGGQFDPPLRFFQKCVF